MRRAEDDAVITTLMEIWQHPAGIAAHTAERIADEGNRVLQPWLSGARHVERFVAD